MPKRLMILVILAAAGLGGCNPLSPLAPTQGDVLTAGVLSPADASALPPVYCYRTLAEPMCYRSPQAGQWNRLIAAYPPIDYPVHPASDPAY